VNDQELADVLGATTVRREPWPYASTAPMEELHVDGRLAGRRLLLKHLAHGGDTGRPAPAGDPLRELKVYRQVLAPRAIDAPICHAAVDAPPRGWLVLELVDGIPLWQAGDVAVWEAVAGWLARLHRSGPPSADGVVRYDAALLRRSFVKGSFPRAERVGMMVSDHLASLPATFIHGEFYPSNVLVSDARSARPICAVDWETAGIGAGVLDIAALTAGAWSDADRDRIAQAYVDACPPGHRPQPGDIEHARLLFAARWLGLRGRWSPPPHHAHDWGAEVRSLVERLGL
jgi:hypothetical protein